MHMSPPFLIQKNAECKLEKGYKIINRLWDEERILIDAEFLSNHLPLFLSQGHCTQNEESQC